MKRVLGIILALSMVLSFGGCSYTPAEQTESPTGGEEQTKERTFTYVNRWGEEFYYSITGDDVTIYEKTPGELIQEWEDNVALAEKTYLQSKSLIVTEGYIRDINKDEFDDTYYIKLADEIDGFDVLGMDEIAVYFRTEREYEELLNYRKGDYITIACIVEDTTSFLEYPKLSAKYILGGGAIVEDNNAEHMNEEYSEFETEDLEGLTVQDVVGRERWALIAAMISDDLGAYDTGGKSLFESLWNYLRTMYGDQDELLWYKLEQDAIAYFSGEDCQFAAVWNAGEQSYSMFCSGELEKQVSPEDYAELMNCYESFLN